MMNEEQHVEAGQKIKEKPYYYHSLRVTPPTRKPKHFRKVTRSETFPEILVNIAHLAFEANRLFDALITVEAHSSQVNQRSMVRADLSGLIDDEDYVEGDAETSPDDMLPIPDATFWTT